MLRLSARRFCLFAASLLTLLVSSCSSDEVFEVAQPSRLPDASVAVENVLLVTLGSARVDRLGAYGDTSAVTPNLDALAADGTIFDDCQSPAPLSLSAVASLMTGTYGFEHGARNNTTHWLDTQLPTLAEALRSADIKTLAAVSSEVLGYDSGLTRGFTTFDGDLSAGLSISGRELLETHASNTVDRALALLDKQGDSRWFLWIHLEDPSAPYLAPDGFRGSTPDGYGDELAYVDSEIGRLLKALETRGQRVNTLVAVTAVAGEGLGQNSEIGHGLLLRDTTLHVPLIVSHASVAGGSRVPGSVSLIDLAPTLAEVFGVSFSTTDSRSLVASLRDPAVHNRERFVYSEALRPMHEYGLAPIYSVHSSSTRLVENVQRELYDLVTDPGELTNAYRAAREDETGATAALAEFRSRESHDRRAQILRLNEVTNRISTKVAIERIGAAQSAFSRMRSPYSEQDVNILIALTKQMPGWTTPRSLMASQLRSTGKADEALKLMQSALQYGAVRASSLMRLASLEQSLEIENWEERLNLAEALEPASIAPLLFRVRLAHQAQGLEGSRPLLEAAIAKRPYDVLLISELAALSHKSGDFEAARALSKKVQRIATSWARGYELEGEALLATNRAEEALAVYDSRLADHPNQVTLVALAARVEWNLKRFDASRARLERALNAQPNNLAMLSEATNQALTSARWADADHLLMRLCELDPNKSANWESRLRCLLATGKLDAAAEVATQVLELNPKHFPSLTFQAVKQEQDENLEQAVELFLRAQQVNPKALAREVLSNPLLTRIQQRIDG